MAEAVLTASGWAVRTTVTTTAGTTRRCGEYVDRIGGRQIVERLVDDLRELPDKADFYTDLGSDEGFAVILGKSECG